MLINRKTFLVLFLFLSSIAPVFAQRNSFYYQFYGVENVVGTIQKVGRNTIEIYDESDKYLKRFIYLYDTDQFVKGQRVRIYYYPRNNVIQNIIKMKIFEYKEGQNLGYLKKIR